MEWEQSLKGYSTVWLHYDAYEIRPLASGEHYLLPAKEAQFTLYDPFLQAEELLGALLSLGQTAGRYGQDGVETEAALMELASRFGLLGLVTTGVYNRDIIGEKAIVLNERNVTGQTGIVEAEGYWRQFAPFAEADELYLHRYRRGVDLRKAEDSPKFYGKRPLVMELVFSRFYAEQTRWIVDFAEKLVRHLEMLLVYQQNQSTLTESVEIMPEFFQPERISFTIKQGQRTQLVWQVDALRTAVELIYGFMAADEQRPLKKCPYCGKLFIAHSRKEKYCSPSCRNCANVIKSRQRRMQEERENG